MFTSPPSRNYNTQPVYTPQQETPLALTSGEDSGYFSRYQSQNSLVTIPVKSNEEAFERKLNPDEQAFHSLLQQCMAEQSPLGGEGVSGVPAVDNIGQAEIVGRYAAAAQDRFVELSQEARRHYAGFAFSIGGGESFAYSDRRVLTGSGSDRRAANLQREVQEQRAERDLWSLLETLTVNNLLYDIDERACEEKLEKVLSGLSVTASIPDYIDAAFSVDDRLRKGAVLKEWVEKAALDLVSETPAPRGEPWSDTLNRVLRSRHPSRSNPTTQGNQVVSLHPDGQLTNDGMLMALDGVDRLDQESLLKTIWQLVRCGHVLRAQQLASEHRLFWLAASLQGIATHTYKYVTASNDAHSAEQQEYQAQQEEEVVGVARVGNLKQPVWLRTCWLYATKLSSNTNNFTHQVLNTPHGNSNSLSSGRALRKEDSLVGVLEMSIYAALCNHTKVLLASPLVATWADRVWVYLKAAHERDLSRIVHVYRCTKNSHSKYYAGCDSATISAERELTDLSRLEIGHLSTANCVQIFNKITPPSAGRNAESFILNLQAAVMEGRSGILNFVENTMSEFLHSSDDFPGKDLVIRVFAHFCIWLKYAHQDDAALPELVSLETMYLAIEKYIDLLIAKKQRSLVAAYAAYLNRPRRIHKYAQLLRSMQTSAPSGVTSQVARDGTTSGQNADAAEVLQLANVFFPADVMDITRSVVEAAAQLTIENNVSSGVSGIVAKRGAAPPLHSLTSTSSPLPNQGRAGHSVRFALSPAGTAGGSAMTATEEEDTQYITTPAKRSVRSRLATPRPSKGATPAATPSAGDVSASAGLRGMQSPLTPSVGSSLMVYDTLSHRALPVHTTLRCADPTGSTAISPADLQQMESLRWLFFEPTHRIEAVKQANRMIVSYLLHQNGMKLAQVRLLLADYVPLDSVAMGYSLLEQRRNAIEGIEQDYLHAAGVHNALLLPVEECAHVGALKAELQAEEGVWDAQVCKLHLWQSFTSSLQDSELFYRTVSDFQTEASRLLVLPTSGSRNNSNSSAALLGRHRAKIVRTATTAADALLNTITCAAASVGGSGVAGASNTSEDNSMYENPADGYKDIWTQNEASTTAWVTRTLTLLQANLQDLVHSAAQMHDEEEKDGVIDAQGWAEISTSLHSLSTLADELYTSAEGAREGEKEFTVVEAIRALQEVVREGVATSGQINSRGEGRKEEDVETKVLTDAALSVVTALGQCKAHLSDVKEGRQLAGALLFQILTSYLQVCMSAGSVLQSLGHSRDAASWLSRALRLADLVATEDYSLQLYTLLHRDDLEALLQGINSAALSLLAIDPEMNILSSSNI